MEQRTIKFRAWNPVNNRMISSVGFTDSDIGRIWRQEEYMMGENAVDMRNEWLPMQFTGLKDKNGKEIYEGDILRDYDPDDGNEDLVVEFRDGQWWWGNGNGNSIPLHDLSPEVDGVVIGNIYSNPELLTK